MRRYGGNANGRTRIRIIQYAMYGDRGVWIAKRLRSLWNRGCDIKIIYGVTSRPVLQILRNRSGRGAIPMRQSVTKNGSGEIVKYNHSKWMTITGRWAPSRSAWLTFNGLGELVAARLRLRRADAAHPQPAPDALPYLRAFNKTWKPEDLQDAAGRPGGHASAAAPTHPGRVPRTHRRWGQGDLPLHAALTQATRARSPRLSGR